MALPSRPPPSSERELVFGDCVLRPQSYTLIRNGAYVETEPKVIELIALLASDPDRVLPKDEILARLWPGTHVSESSLTRCVSLARSAVGDAGGHQAIIRTVYGRGYQFVAQTRAPSGGPADGYGTTRPIVGRARELAVVDEAFRDASLARGRVVTITGEPGIGKSRLAEEIRDLARARGADVRFARCREVDGAAPFSPWWQILGDRGGAPATAALFARPSPGDHDGADPARVARYRMFTDVVATVRGWAQTRLLVLVFDDLHRADLGSLHLLACVCSEIVDHRVLIVATYRQPVGRGEHGRRAVLADLSRAADARCLTLRGLDSADLARLVDQEDGCELSAAALRSLYDHTAGNPFFITRLLPFVRAAHEPGWSAALRTLPTDVRDAVARQAADLPADCRKVLRVAATVGREFEVAIVAAAVDRPTAWVVERLRPARDIHLIEPRDEDAHAMRFVHLVVRDTLYDRLDAAERIRWHARIVQALERFPEPRRGALLDELAEHAFQAVPVDGIDKAVRYAIRAAERAEEQAAHEVAARHYGRAVDMLDAGPPADASRLCDLVLALGESHVRAGDRREGTENLLRAARAARSLGDGGRLARAALGLAPGFLAIEAGIYDRRLIAALEETLAALSPENVALRAQVTARLAQALYFSDDPARRDQLSDEAVAIAETADDAGVRAYAHVARVAAQWGPDNFEERRTVLPEALAGAHARGERSREIVYRLFWITTLIEAGDWSHLRREIDDYGRDAERLGEPQALWGFELLRTMTAVHDGRLDAAAELSEAFLALGRRAGDRNAAQSYAVLHSVRGIADGRLEHAIAQYREHAAQYPGVVAWRFGLAWLLASDGAIRSARTLLARLCIKDLDDLPRNAHWLSAMACGSEACATVGDTTRASLFRDRLRPFANRHVVIGFGTGDLGSVAYYLGRLAATMGDEREARDWFELALEQNRRTGAVIWLAKTLAAYAAFLRSHGRQSEVRRAHALDREGSLLFAQWRGGRRSTL
jgi:DNA-binding winged helix-turn-helix (wHTH) protein